MQRVIRTWWKTWIAGAIVAACAGAPAEPKPANTMYVGSYEPRDVETRISFGAGLSARQAQGVLHVRNNTQQDQVLHFVVQVMDPTAAEVVPAVLGKPFKAPARTSQTQGFVLPPLPEGRHWVRLTTQAEVGDVREESQAYLEVAKGRVREIDEFRWSGQDERQSPPPKLPAGAEARFVRAAGEWQGMPPDRIHSMPWTPEMPCGMALAFVDGFCLPCLRDGECLQGEQCVLNHCVPAKAVECRVRADCKQGQLCTLTGYTGGDPRANSDMRAVCSGSTGRSHWTEADVEAASAANAASATPAPPGGPDPRVRAAELLEQSRRSR